MIVWAKQKNGFTIVELLIVIVVIAILAAITIVAYNGIQTRTKNSSTQAAISQLQRQVEAYAAETGSFPSTGSLGNVYTDSNCGFSPDDNGQESADWIPGLRARFGTVLPQSSFGDTGRSGAGGCYMYASNGTQYIITAWNAKYGGPSTDGLYRRLGFREVYSGFTAANTYYCNHNGAIGGLSGGVYTATSDYYKYSYTASNISDCNESPPSGA